MNTERIRELDRAWSVYMEWLTSEARDVHDIRFCEWLHIEYEKARKDKSKEAACK